MSDALRSGWCLPGEARRKNQGVPPYSSCQGIGQLGNISTIAVIRQVVIMVPDKIAVWASAIQISQRRLNDLRYN